MSDQGEVNDDKDLEFKWGKKRGVGGKKKEVQFYESFTYDGLEYTLHDSVYLHKEGALPYIGKLIKIWENADKTKKVKVHWFFRPSEILHCLQDKETLENEIFLASGQGVGLANVNPLEAIAGKISVVCVSTDSRNPQPSVEELQMADYVFYRTFDVGHLTISDKMGDKVAGIEVKFIFNRKECERDICVPKLDSDEKENNLGAVAYNKRLQLHEKNQSEDFRTVNIEGFSNHLEAKEDEVVKASLAKRELLAGEKPASGVGVDSNDVAVNSGKGSSVSDHKTKTRCMANYDKDELKLSVIPVDQVDFKERVQSDKGSDALDDKPSKKARVGSSVILSEDKNLNSDRKLTINRNDMKPLVTTVSSADGKARSVLGKDSLGLDKGVKSAKDRGAVEDRPFKKARVDSSVKLSTDKNRNNVQSLGVNSGGNLRDSTVTSYEGKAKSRLPKDSIALDKGLPEKQKLNERMSKLSNGKLLKESAEVSLHEEKTEGKGFEVSRRPDVDKSKWFRELPWEERIQNAHERGTLVLLRNLDPEYTSAEVEDIIWHGFEESCTAKMLQRTIISSPHSGQALVIFKTREAAEGVIRKLDEGCLMLSDGRPLIGSIAPPPSFPGKQSTFFGHLSIDKIKLQMQREMRQAVSTSHCSQPNTIEYEMAMEWCLLQERSESSWKRLYKQQGEQLKKLKANLKSK
ncbi:protein ANTI-SILENCING 1-like [Cornus florida]|uniref:protein ANTI-SILENCING 1-like n=1 Tax=Cornus florida TaxID=4283 RepID=UPI00289CD454|nr:protein ANTI-SILENCING 1-like [Cornus florida]XP_059633113.1 protein ANTI-SILENCING 1-like [Cornus florida]